MTRTLFRDDAYQTEAEATVTSSDPRGVALDCTVFYPQGGGQSGDRGTLVFDSGPPMAVVNTVYDADRATILHVPADGAALPRRAPARSSGSTGTCATGGCAPIPRFICCRSSCLTR